MIERKQLNSIEKNNTNLCDFIIANPQPKLL